jgi:transaldolase/glucose-6-phosphate isomerase
MHDSLAAIDRFATGVRKEGFRHVVLMGMGGSSLAPEVFGATFGVRRGYPELVVLDSTHPDAVRNVGNRVDLSRTLFVVASKSGTTLETRSFFTYFWDKVQGLDSSPGDHFVAITDPGTPLETIAGERGFRRVFHGPADVGGRFSALSVFGLLPAALIGVDIHRILDGSWAMMDSSVAQEPGAKNPLLVLGAVLGELAVGGRDKLTLVTSPALRSLPVWIEQLVAESTGKDGKGVLPVVDEPFGAPELYGDDRNFVQISLKGDSSKDDELLSMLERADHPVTRIQVTDSYLLGQEFFRWEIAVAAAGSILGIHPFNQPDVQLAKDLAKRAMEKTGETAATGWDDGVETVPIGRSDDLAHSIESWLSSGSSGDYIALNVFLSPSEAAAGTLQEVRVALRARSGLATTVGYGPRFLHSTGQLHKGGPNNGLFVQIVDEPEDPVPVPETDYSFGELIRAQALGDAQALVQRGRRVIRVNLGRTGVDGLDSLLAAVRG